MVRTTRAQREALWNLYCRENKNPTVRPGYKAFRKTIQPMFCSDPCVLVEKFGIWFGIEVDGYTHT